MKRLTRKISRVGRALALTAIFVCLSACGQNLALKVKDFSLEATKIYYGDLLASMLKESGRATLIGSKTGGGACAVYPASSAIGTYFNTSSHFRFSAEKNGVFKDIDDGVSPDYKLTELRSFYNRSDKNGLTAFIKKLY